jgi:hypothetical protein
VFGEVARLAALLDIKSLGVDANCKMLVNAVPSKKMMNSWSQDFLPSLLLINGQKLFTLAV